MDTALPDEFRLRTQIGHFLMHYAKTNEIVDVRLAEATAELKLVPSDWFDVTKTLFG